MELSRYPAQHPLGPVQGKQVLSIDPGLGSIYVCDHCESLHLDLGQTHVRMGLAVFQAMLNLMERAAANYELWAETNRRPS